MADSKRQGKKPGTSRMKITDETTVARLLATCRYQSMQMHEREDIQCKRQQTSIKALCSLVPRL